MGKSVPERAMDGPGADSESWTQKRRGGGCCRNARTGRERRERWWPLQGAHLQASCTDQISKGQEGVSPPRLAEKQRLPRSPRTGVSKHPTKGAPVDIQALQAKGAVSVEVTQLCRCSMKAASDGHNERGCMAIKPNLQRQGGRPRGLRLADHWPRLSGRWSPRIIWKPVRTLISGPTPTYRFRRAGWAWGSAFLRRSQGRV